MDPLQRSKSVSQPDNLQIQHFIHQHLLHKLYMTSKFNCDGCNTRGEGVRFRCSACDFDLHEQCAASWYRISSHLHPHHQLILVNRPGGELCKVCKQVTKGLSYTCENQTCEFNVHTLCVQTPVSTTALAVYNGVSYNNNNQPVLINHHQMQGTPTTAFGGYNGVINNQPVMVNHAMQLGGYNGVNNHHQPVMVNYQQQQKQGVQTTAFGGYQGMNNNQTHQMIHHHQQQMIPTAAGFDGYQGGMVNTQPVMVNHHQQLQQQQQLMMNNNQTVMFNHPPGQQSTTSSNGYTKVGKFAANILATSLIGIPIFNSRK